MNNEIYIGTSGWSYSGWINHFYPDKIKPNEVLPFYSQQFNSVELNNSFYQFPKIENVEKWVDVTPSDFIFSCKANRYITHQKKLHEVEESVERLLSVFECFGEKLGPILFQFPPSWEVNIERLKSFISGLSSAFQYTFEFRAQSWFCPELYDLLAKHKMSLCVYNYKGIESPEILCSDFMYMRMHGPEKTAYTGSYTDEQLENWAKKIRNWQQMGKAIYCYFDNDQKAHAPHDARRLRKLLNDQI